MPTPRNQQISLSDTPFYHCIARCVRRAFLCGTDAATGKDYSHRKDWVTERLALLANTFAIDVCAYAVLDNHLHSVLKINAKKAKSWPDNEVINRWQQLFTLPVLVECYLAGECHSEAEQHRAQEDIAVYRERLMDISWFMRCLNEHIARKANAEDNCTGHFWEGRFKSQALLNEQAVIACMAYVDLNPIRADICASLEDSEYTSVKQRIDEISSKPSSSHTPPIKLAQFIGASLTEEGIPFSLKDYLELTDWTGRSVRTDKSGFIKTDTPKILVQLGLDEECWMETVLSFSSDFHTFIGPEEHLQSLCQKQKKKWLRGLLLCRKLFKPNNFCPIPI
ncbi:MAG: transposase [Gammaproteobacteria bacterium]|nr:transposase [Gammaproteobacteria bacterium]